MGMRNVSTVARRELGTYVFSPSSYVIAAMFVAASGLWFFLRVFVPGGDSTLRSLFEQVAVAMIFVAPLLTMRLISEEFRSGTIETLMTAPVTEVEVIVGKFLGVLWFYAMVLLATVVYLLLMVAYGSPDWGVVAMGYLGLLLLGAAFLAVGMFTSSVTRHQLLAALLGVAILGAFTGLMTLGASYAPDPFNHLAKRLNALNYFTDFARGTLDTAGVVFFLSATLFFLFLSIKALESRRWL